MTNIIGQRDSRKINYDPDLANKINQKVAEEKRQGVLEKKINTEPKTEEPMPEIAQEKPAIVNPNYNPIKGFIYIPSIKMYVAKEKRLEGFGWRHVWEALEEENMKMPTIYQFKEFLRYLKENPQGTKDASSKEIESILDEILTARDPWRSEWLDAYFEVKEYGGYISGMHIMTENKSKSEVLDDYLEKSKCPGIDLNHWLYNSNKQGLPKEKAKKGDLNYWSPERGSVARFYANSIRANLSCYGSPENSDSSLGVRAIKAVQKEF